MKLPFFGRDDEDEDYGPQEEEEEEEEVEGDGLLGRFTAILSPARLLRWRPGEALNANDRSPEEPEPPSLEGLTAVALPEDGSPLSVDVVVPESGDHAGEPETPVGAPPTSSNQAPGDLSGDLSGDPLGEPAGPLSAASDEALPSAAEDDEDDEDEDDEDDEDEGGGAGEGGSVLDGLMDLFEDSYESDSHVRELAVSLEELDMQDLARQCQELARDLKQRKPAA